MRALVVADIHGRRERLQSEDVDVAFIVGDFTNADDPSFAEEVLDSFTCKVFAIPGNMDRRGVLDALERRGVSVHLRVVEYEEFSIFGLGGSNPTPFNTPFEMREDEIEKELSRFKDAYSIAVIHAPPYGLFDWVGKQSVGSIAIRRWIEKNRPKLVFCAHIHEHQGVAKLRETMLIKVGAAIHGNAAIVDVDESMDNIAVKFIRI
jgi:hypothetical protein